MTILNQIIATAKARSPHIPHIVLPEGQDERVLIGADRAVRSKIARISILGSTEKILASAKAIAIDCGAFTLIDPQRIAADLVANEAMVEAFLKARKGKADRNTAAKAVREPLVYAALMVKTGLADGTLGGAVHTTADTVRAALQIIGKAPETNLVSSYFLMNIPARQNSGTNATETIVFSDCALIVEPDSQQLASIAIDSAESFRSLTSKEPYVALLSFSTKGSAAHEAAQKVATALTRINKLSPDLIVDGELQFDAAFDNAVGQSKAPASKVAGRANVFVFPNLDAGNIGYKIAQRIGGAEAIGPILQGLAKPANDLSRGCSASDVFNMIAVTAAQCSK